MQTIASKTLIDQMVLIRVVEEELQKLCDIGEASDLHFSRGQEAIAVGAIAALRDTDYVVGHHRIIPHAIAKGIPLCPLIAELLGKPEGLNGGMAGEMHLSSVEHRYMFAPALIASGVPVAAGVAWAVKNHVKTDDIVVVFHGDAATANGQWHEGMNLAAVNQVPLLIICENNGLAGNVRPEKYQPVDQLWERVRGYLPSGSYDWVDGNHIEEVIDAVEIFSREIRERNRPLFLECKTTRLSKHKQGQGDLRTGEEMAQLAKLDPLRDVPEEDFASARKEVRSIIEAVHGNMD